MANKIMRTLTLPNEQGENITYDLHPHWDNIEGKPEVNEISARYNSIEDALNEINIAPDGKVATYNIGENLHIMLLEDVESSTVINITKDCTLHLNGKTLSFTAPGAYLNINTASEVTINGMVAGSAIVKNGITSTAYEDLVCIANTHVVFNGGTYSVQNADFKGIYLLYMSNDSASADMYNCDFIASGINNTPIYGFVVYNTNLNSCSYTLSANNNSCNGFTVRSSLTMTDCVIDIDAGKTYATGVQVTGGDCTFTDCSISVRSPAEGANVQGIATYAGTSVVIDNCQIEADGAGDVGESSHLAVAVACNNGASITINGGYYWGAREALSIVGTARINGGVYEGCQHGGGYMMGADIKVKNAIFRNVEYTGNCGWDVGFDPHHYGAVYCGGNAGNANVYFDNCQFEAENYANNGIVAKYTGTNAYLSNCIFKGPFGQDLRVDSPNHMYVGKDVSYNTSKVSGTPDTTTYANQEFGFETELKDYEALVEIKTSLLENKINELGAAPAGFVANKKGDIGESLIHFSHMQNPLTIQQAVIEVEANGLELPRGKWIATIYKNYNNSSIVKVVDLENGYECKAIIKDNGIGEWEWEHPPMYRGDEYRTTERWESYPVYIQLLEINSGSLSTSYDISNLNLFISAKGIVYTDQGDYTIHSFHIDKERAEITIRVDEGIQPNLTRIEIKYIKTNQ